MISILETPCLRILHFQPPPLCAKFQSQQWRCMCLGKREQHGSGLDCESPENDPWALFCSECWVVLLRMLGLQRNHMLFLASTYSHQNISHNGP